MATVSLLDEKLDAKIHQFWSCLAKNITNINMAQLGDELKMVASGQEPTSEHYRVWRKIQENLKQILPNLGLLPRVQAIAITDYETKQAFLTKSFGLNPPSVPMLIIQKYELILSLSHQVMGKLTLEDDVILQRVYQLASQYQLPNDYLVIKYLPRHHDSILVYNSLIGKLPKKIIKYQVSDKIISFFLELADYLEMIASPNDLFPAMYSSLTTALGFWLGEYTMKKYFSQILVLPYLRTLTGYLDFGPLFGETIFRIVREQNPSGASCCRICQISSENATLIDGYCHFCGSLRVRSGL